MKNVISIDVEQWFHRPVLLNRVTEKDKNPDHILESVRFVLKLFKKYDKRTTFFILGEVAEQAPELVKEIIEDGHEIAFHGCSHVELQKVGEEYFKTNVRDFTKLISSITKEKVRGFRGSIFSLNKETAWTLDVLSENGYTYDSSVFPVKTPLYGSNDAPIHPYYPSFTDPTLEDPTQRKLIEWPILVRNLWSLRFPSGGGFYMRALGFNYIFNSIKALNMKGYPAMCYFHPWEIYGFPKITG